MGALYWQLNPVWPGASLSGFEFGGRWKVANHFVEPMFRPLIVSVDERVGGRLDVFLINDARHAAKNLTVKLYLQRYSEFKPCYETEFANLTAPAKKSSAFQPLAIDDILSLCDFDDVVKAKGVKDVEVVAGDGYEDDELGAYEYSENMMAPRLATESPK